MNRVTNPQKIVTTSLLTVTLLVQFCYANSPQTDFSAEFEAGVKNDSHLKIEEIDKNESSGDTAKVFKFKLKGEWKPVTPLSFKTSYSLNQKQFQHNSDFDQSLQHYNFDASYNFSWVTLGSSLNSADVKVADASFLKLNQQNIYLAKLFAKTIYLRASKSNQKKTFDVYRDRNENSRAISGDMFFFFNSGRTVLSISYANEDAIADATEFSYQSIAYQTKFSNRFSLFNKDSQWQVGWKIQNKDYLEFNPILENSRYDKKDTRALQVEVDFFPHFSAIGKVQHTRSRSNFNEAEYSATELSLTFKYQI